MVGLDKDRGLGLDKYKGPQLTNSLTERGRLTDSLKEVD